MSWEAILPVFYWWVIRLQAQAELAKAEARVKELDEENGRVIGEAQKEGKKVHLTVRFP